MKEQPKIPTYWLLYIAMVTVGMGQTVIFAVMPMLGRELQLDKLVLSIPFLGIDYQLSELAITILSALTALTFALASPLWGRVSDKYGRKPVITIGLIGYTIGMTLFAIVAYLGLKGVLTGFVLYVLLIVTRFVHSMLMSASYPASNAYIVDISHESKRTKALGRLAACMQIGIICGPILAYLMMVDFLLPFIAQALIMFVMGLLILFKFPYHKPENTGAPSAKLRYLDPRYRRYLMIGLLVYIGLGMVQQTLGFYFQDILLISEIDAAREYSKAMAFSSVAMLLAQFGIVQRASIRPQNLIRLGLPFLLLGFVVLALSSSKLLLWFGMFLFGFGMGLVGPSFTASASLTVGLKEQGALAGLVGSVAGFGFVLGPLIGGVVYSIDIHLPYYLSAFAVAFGLSLTLGQLPSEKT